MCSVHIAQWAHAMHPCHPGSQARNAPLHSSLTAVGFEPAQLALVELESTPLGHSGKLSTVCAAYGWAQCAAPPGWVQIEDIRSAQTPGTITYSLQGLNPRPMAHKTITLTTEL